MDPSTAPAAKDTTRGFSAVRRDNADRLFASGAPLEVTNQISQQTGTVGPWLSLDGRGGPLVLDATRLYTIAYAAKQKPSLVIYDLPTLAPGRVAPSATIRLSNDATSVDLANDVLVIGGGDAITVFANAHALTSQSIETAVIPFAAASIALSRKTDLLFASDGSTVTIWSDVSSSPNMKVSLPVPPGPPPTKPVSAYQVSVQFGGLTLFER